MLFHIQPLLLTRSSSSSVFPARSLGFTIFGEIFAYGIVFKSNHRHIHILSSLMVHAGWVFVVAFTRLGHKYQDSFSPCDGMNVCTDQTSVYTHTLKGQWAQHTTDWAISAPPYRSKVNKIHIITWLWDCIKQAIDQKMYQKKHGIIEINEDKTGFYFGISISTVYLVVSVVNKSSPKLCQSRA